MGDAINGFAIHTRFIELGAKEIKCLVFANLFHVIDSGVRFYHMKNDNAVVGVARVKERIISYVWDKRVLVIVWIMLAKNGFNEMSYRVRFVCAKVDALAP